ncbi:MAG: CapA family protein [Lachnospiraceae bacterium]|nr:CapA family protein [Lachnospiraceae bacterium]
MADRRRKRKKKKSNSIYKVVAAAVGVCMVALIGLVAYYFISSIDFNFNVKTPGTIAEVKVLPTYDAAVTPTEWAELEKNVPVEISQNLQIMMVGDMLMHLNVTQSGFKDDGTKNYDHLFERILPDIQAADIRIVNEEIVFAGEDMGFSGYPMFNTAEEVGDAEAKAGFNVILHATNHTMDKWKQGLLNTINFWKKYPDIMVLGVNETKEQQDEITVFEKNGMKIALLNYTYGLNGMPQPDDMPFAVNLIDADLMDRNIKKAHEVADFVVVLIHWGNEYQLSASNDQKYWCNWFLERDVDLIIGAHPHVIQPIEWYTDPNDGDEMLVYYSLGNYVTGTRAARAGVYEQAVGGMAKVELTKNAQGEVVISRYGVEPLVANIGRGGYQSIYTCPLSEYTEEERKNTILASNDPTFTIENCEDLCEKVWGDLYNKGEKETWITKEY